VREGEAAPAMPGIKYDAAFARFEEEALNVACAVQ
jgi:hypothetical protein